MKVLGLDLSLTGTGIAVIDDGVVDGRWLVKTNGSAPDLERFDYIAREVMNRVYGDSVDLGHLHTLDLVAMEGVYASRNLFTYGRLTALSTCVQYALFRSKVPFVTLHATAWRKALFGPKSKVDKEKVRAAVAGRLKAHLGTMDAEQVDLNVLEAFCVGLAAWKMEIGEVPRPMVKRSKKEPE